MEERKRQQTLAATVAFNRYGTWSSIWAEQSTALNRAAMTVAKQATIGDRPATDTPIALMLGGYAIETLLKMVVIADHCKTNGLILDNVRADFVPKTHDLVRLAAKAKLRTTKSDRKLLATLSRFTVWAGRYPIPLIASGYQGPARFENRGLGPILPHPAWADYPNLYSKLFRLALCRTFERASLNPEFFPRRKKR
jgi:hypothetical protein